MSYPTNLIKYPKIPALWKRSSDRPHNVLMGAHNDIYVRALQGIEWEWTEKIDGTNIRVHWDGHDISFHGRTEKSDLPKGLYHFLHESYATDAFENLIEEIFKDRPVTLFGEGCGKGIQKNGDQYSDTPTFKLFDIYSNLWYSRDAVVGIAEHLGIDVVPIMFHGPVAVAVQEMCMWAIDNPEREGWVGKPAVGALLDPQGHRIMVKIKPEEV